MYGAQHCCVYSAIMMSGEGSRKDIGFQFQHFTNLKLFARVFSGPVEAYLNNERNCSTIHTAIYGDSKS